MSTARENGSCHSRFGKALQVHVGEAASVGRQVPASEDVATVVAVGDFTDEFEVENGCRTTAGEQGGGVKV